MKRLYLKHEVINAIAKGEKPPTTPIGYAYDEHDRGLVIFLATDRETGKVLTDKKGNWALNLKPAR